MRAALEGDDDEAIKAKTDALYTALHKISERIYAEQAQQQAGQEQPGAGGSGADEDVVDADYTVVDEEENKQ